MMTFETVDINTLQNPFLWATPAHNDSKVYCRKCKKVVSKILTARWMKNDNWINGYEIRCHNESLIYECDDFIHNYRMNGDVYKSFLAF